MVSRTSSVIVGVLIAATRPTTRCTSPGGGGTREFTTFTQVGDLAPSLEDSPEGENGMSRVYLARHTHLKRPTAVKVLKTALASDEVGTDWRTETTSGQAIDGCSLAGGVVSVQRTEASQNSSAKMTVAVNAYYAAYYDTTLRFALLSPRILLTALLLGIALGVAAGSLAALRIVRVPPQRLGER